MNHTLRDFARQSFGAKLGQGATARNAEISVLNWTVQNVRSLGKEASWENPIFRTAYKRKLTWLLNEMERGEKVRVTLGVEGDRVKFQWTLEPQLVHRLRRKELDVKNLAKYPADILWPDGPWAAALMKAREKDLMMEKAKMADENYNGLFKCRKCKSVKTSYYQMQTRSADEPMVRSLLLAFLIIMHVLTTP